MESLLDAPVSTFHNIADLLLQLDNNRESSAPLLLGTVGTEPAACDIRRMRLNVIQLDDHLNELGLAHGDTVCLIRLPRTSETVLALAYAAFSAVGIRVLLPMFPDIAALPRWLRETDSKAVFWNKSELRRDGLDPDRAWLAKAEAELKRIGMPSWCLEERLGLEKLLRTPASELAEPDLCRLRDITAADNLDDECLILTTTGTSGEATLVCYTQRALLASTAAWESAGLYREATQGGRGLCLLLSHSMGVRAFWNAMHTREALCLIPPEWFHEHPSRVSALLQEMRPQHITGGPAAYRALLELIRVYPDLKENGLGHLKVIVSSGARFDDGVARRIEGALGLSLSNAFGTTETMQVLSTLVGGPFTRGLGNALPGVQVMLEPVESARQPLRRMWIRSPFAASRCIGSNGEVKLDSWFATGDLVEQTATGLRFVGREGDEMVKDGFGVKISRALVERRYRGLGSQILHLEHVPLREEPGLAALIFLESTGTDAENGQLVTDPSLLGKVRSRLIARYEHLQPELDDFELRHLTIARFACVAGPPPVTAKGDIARRVIESQHAVLLSDLAGPAIRRPGLEFIDRAQLLLSDTTRFAAPLIGEVLQLLRLDKDYSSGTGDRLTWIEDGEVHQAVDFVGGFGVNLLGHNRPELVAAATRFLMSGAVALADQGSARRMEGELARELSLIISGCTGRSFVVRFGSTGAEAMEMALAHALLERLDALDRFVVDQIQLAGGRETERVERIAATARAFFRVQRPVVLTLNGAFHGHSLGARSVSGLRQRARYAPLIGIETCLVSQEDLQRLGSLLETYSAKLPAFVEEGGKLVLRTKTFSRIIAAVAEPIRGEGGVHVADPVLLNALAAREFPLILDEIQCGLGRAGRFLASEGIPGAYYLLGKALGGGLAKISALLIERNRYRRSFDEDYMSTFGGDGLSCTVGKEVLAIIRKEDVPRRAALRGQVLRDRLESVRRDHPSVIRAIDGEGLMLGVLLDERSANEFLLFRFAIDRKRFGLLASAYLLNRWGVRILPTLSAPSMLRVEPSAWVDDEAIAQLERGLRAFCGAIEDGNTAEIVGVLIERELKRTVPGSRSGPLLSRTYNVHIDSPPRGAVRVGFLKHFVLPEQEVAFIEPSFRGIPHDAQRALYDRLMPLLECKPSISFARSLFGDRIWFASILLPVDPATIEELQRSGNRRRIVERVQEGIALAAAEGCTVAGLGAYTSIVTDDGEAILAPSGMRISTGNALTVAVGIRRVLAACRHVGVQPEESVAGVVGATGNIGQALAWRLAYGERSFQRIVLLGRDQGRLDALATKLRAAAPAHGPIPDFHVSTSLSDLRQCSAIVAAAGTNERLVFPRHVKESGRVVVADLSVPGVVAAAVRGMRNVKQLPLAGTVTVPGTPDFSLASHIRSGTAFACAGEAMLLGLAPSETSNMRFTGAIDPCNVARLEQLAIRFGMMEELAPAHAASHR
jgi:acetylornithine/succinyldiaminopimelate/putrescine aminotransferase/predicted amino acid dehydrogenase/acyl-coenzyme A synthetase/AMP-(fatty) acid ligase